MKNTSPILFFLMAYISDKNLKLLQDLAYTGMIGEESISQWIQMTRKAFISKEHGKRIWQGADGRYYTHIYEGGVRKLRSRASLEELEAYIVRFYEKSIPKNTLLTEFEEWITKKRAWKELDEATVIRYRSDFKRFFTEEAYICQIDVSELTDYIVEDFIKTTIAKFHLTAKSYQNFGILLRGVLKFAKKQGHTTYSIGSFFRDFDLSEKVFARPSEASQLIFSREDRKKLYEYCMEHQNIWNLGIALHCLTGIRMGELCSLKKEDMIAPGKLYIHRTETRFLREDGSAYVDVKDEGKQGHNGLIFLPKAGEEIFEKVSRMTSGAEYLFSKNGTRITEMSMNYHLRKACKAAGIVYKSSHKMRKTYASVLLNGGAPDTLVQQQMRHNQISTTRQYYHFKVESDEKERDLIESLTSL